MEDNRGAYSGFYKKVKHPSNRKYLILTILVLVLFFVLSGGFGIFNSLENINVKETDAFCGDSTMYNSCSSVKPYYCKDDKLIELASVCGCPEGFGKNGNICFSKYNTGYKNVRLNYTLRGEKGFINFPVYEGFRDYVSKIPRYISSASNTNYLRSDFTLKAIDNEEQAKFLMPLVVKIQNITDDNEDQMRIAISVVQNIPFGASNMIDYFGGNKVNYSRYPYEVVYDMQGICGEKTDLLAFLLREIGYNLSLIYYGLENHEALGLKCPVEESLDGSGYCFVETTAPSIITDNQISYVGVGKLISEPEIYPISSGNSIGDNLEEYKDADKLIRIRKFVEKSGILGPINRIELNKIEEKYGLSEEYYG